MDFSKLQQQRSVWIALLALTAAILAYLTFVSVSRERRMQALQEELAVLRAEFTDASHGLEDCRAIRENLPVLRDDEVERLRRRGLEQPIGWIKNSLRNNAQLIPYQGVQGGEMRFLSDQNIHVLTPRWVLAEFEDGHMAGRILLEYHVADNAGIAWKVIDSYLE